MARRVLRNVGSLLTSRRGAGEGNDDDEDSTHSGGGKQRPPLAISGGFASYHVRVKDVKAFFEARERKRKRRLGFQLEVLFLCFFLPLLIYWNASFGQLDQGARTLSMKEFPPRPLLANENRREVATLNFADGFANEDEFWQWINNVLFDEIFRRGKCGLTVGGSSLAGNKTIVPILAGLVRIRQVRVSAQPCPTSASLMNITCYPAFSTRYEATRPILANNSGLNFTYEYQTSATTTEQTYEGQFGTYPGSGYTINMTTGAPPGMTCNESSLLRPKLQLLAARTSPFIDSSTRAVIVTFTTFAPNTGALVTTRMTTEMSFSGALHTSIINNGIMYFRTSASWLTMQVLTIIVAVIESIFVISSIWGLLFGWSIESHVWMLADLATSGLMLYQMYVLISFFFVSDYFNSFSQSINLLTSGSWSGAGFYSGSELAQLATVPTVNGVILLISGLRLFRYTQYFDFMETIHGTIRRTFVDILLYFFLLSLLSLGYVLCGLVVLGTSLQPWSSYDSAIFTLMQYFLLNVDYYAISDMSPLGLYFAPIFLASFLLIFTWYMFAVFLAVIYVGFRIERTVNQRSLTRRREWERSAEDNGALCIAEDERLLSTVAATSTLDDTQSGGGAATETTPVTRRSSLTVKGGVLSLRSFYYTSFRENLKEWIRKFVGLPERDGFREYSTIIQNLSEYEGKLSQNLLGTNPAKRFMISFTELMDVVNGKSIDLIEELRRTQTDALAAEELRRFRASKVDADNEDKRQLFEDDSDEYLDIMDPVEMQLARLFRILWIIPEDRVDTFTRFEAAEDNAGGQVKRSLLVRIQESMLVLDERETESTRMVAAKIQSLRAVQQAMDRDMQALRDLLK